MAGRIALGRQPQENKIKCLLCGQTERRPFFFTCYCEAVPDRFGAGQTRYATAIALARTNKSSRPSSFWNGSNLVSKRVHRSRKHIHAHHINQLNPQQKRLHARLRVAIIQSF